MRRRSATYPHRARTPPTWTGTGYAMGNAHPAVLAAVPSHTMSNEEDGVAHVLERLFGPPTAP